MLLFDESEVAALARRLRTGDVPAARGDWLSARSRPQPWSLKGDCNASNAGIEHSDEMAGLRDENARLRKELAEVTTASAELLEQIQTLYEG